ncbi:MAG: hypothetical protein QM773_13425 [Hyphomonadaceae bacterium]
MLLAAWEHRRPACILKKMTQLADTAHVQMTPLADRLEQRLDAILQWLEQNAPEAREEQRHLDANTTERAYWHYGYAAALQDIRNCLPGKNEQVS